ncbi:MAG: ferric reductase-like transmembrane domain-containing protein, partial [Thiomonas sp.]
LGHVSPIQAMKQWQRSHPELFNRRVTNQPGHDTYALLHFTAWFGLVNGFHTGMALRDVGKHPFVLAGMTALLLLLPLALTSTNGMIKRLGAARWQRLHRLIYVAGVVAVFHFWWGKLAKNNTATPTVYAVILALLLGLRLWWAWRAARSRRAAAAQGSSRSLA